MAEINLTHIRDEMYLLIYGAVSNNVYLDFLPTTQSEFEEDMVLLDFESAINDLGAYAYGTVRVWLYVKDSDRGADMAELERKYNKAIADYQLTDKPAKLEIKPRLVGAGHDKDRKLKYFMKELKIKIK